MKKKLIPISFAILAMTACEDNNEICQSEIIVESDDITNIIELTQKEYSVLSTLSRTSTKIKEEEVREIISDFKGNKYLGNKIVPIIKNKGIGKSSEADKDTALYVVGSENNEGWAVISGDVRLPETILAYSDEGSVDDVVCDESFTIFMDYLVNYYDSCITNFETEKDSLIDIIYEKSGLETDFSTSLSKKQIAPSLSNTDIIDEWSTSTNWYNTFSIGPLVPVTWKQRGEYNDVLQKNKGKDYRLGCTSLATAQLMAYWKFPNNMHANGILIDWDAITSWPDIEYFDDNTKLQIQTLCYVLSGFCNTTYMKNNSMSLPKNSLGVLSDLGYHVPDDFIQYTKNRVENSIREKTPLIAYGANKVTKGWSIAISIATAGIVNTTIPQHVWLIDGFTRQEMITTKYVTYRDRYNYYGSKEIALSKKAINPANPQKPSNTPKNDNGKEKYSTVTMVYRTSSTKDLIHMNWGWGDKLSSCWYLADVFNCSDAYKSDKKGFQRDAEVQHDEKFSKVHIATSIHPKQ